LGKSFCFKENIIPQKVFDARKIEELLGD